MTATDPLEALRQAAGDPALLALAAVDLTFPSLSVEERARLKKALQVTAVPHWCTQAILADLADEPDPDAARNWNRLTELAIVEPFPARGVGAVNVHEASRLAIRSRLAAVEPDSFARISGRAARRFEHDGHPTAQLEWVYHLLVADPGTGTTELETLYRHWTSGAGHEDRATLVAALTELATAGLLPPRAHVRSRIIKAERRSDLEGTGGSTAELQALLDEARAVDDPALVGDTLCLVGHAAQTRGDPVAAEAAFAEALAIFRRLVELDPTNTGWQSDLAVAHSWIGGLAQDRGDLDTAEAAFAEALAISRRLVELDPTNTGWQSDLAVAHSWIGGLAQDRGDLDTAQAAFAEDLAISRRLVELDPTNTGWQRDLAVAHTRIGGLAQTRGDLDTAQAAFAEDLAISRRLVELDPTNTGWQSDLAVAHTRIGDLAQTRGDLDTAQAAFAEALAISRRLVELDPTNTGWQRGLADTLSAIADLANRRGDNAAAVRARHEVWEIRDQLAGQRPDGKRR